MLASFLVYLQPRVSGPLGLTLGRSLHGLLLRMISEVDPYLANNLHSSSTAKPFTVSMLRGNLSHVRGRMVAVSDDVYRVRYTVLSEPVFAALSHILLGKYLDQAPVSIDGNPFDIVEISVDPARTGGWAGLSSFEQLLEQAGPETRVALRFASPTTFRTGDVNLVFPLPVSVFGSYMRKWEAFSPVPLPDALSEFIAEAVVAERYTLQTEVVNYGRHQFNGFTGDCQFRVLNHDPVYVRAVNALANFALYAGTGQKTTQGMGQSMAVTPNR